MRKIVAIPLLLMCAFGASSACSSGEEAPASTVPSQAASIEGLSTPTIDEDRDSYNEALITGKLGSFVERGKAYFTITPEESSELGLVFPPGYFASSDGKTLKWDNDGVVVSIADAGDLVEFGGGTAAGRDADAWDASEVPSEGVWLAVPDRNK